MRSIKGMGPHISRIDDLEHSCLLISQGRTVFCLTPTAAESSFWVPVPLGDTIHDSHPPSPLSGGRVFLKAAVTTSSLKQTHQA